MPDDTEQLNAAQHDADRAPQVGLECPTCGCRDLRVYYTRPQTYGILRVRICRNCARKVTTREKCS